MEPLHKTFGLIKTNFSFTLCSSLQNSNQIDHKILDENFIIYQFLTKIVDEE